MYCFCGLFLIANRILSTEGNLNLGNLNVVCRFFVKPLLVILHLLPLAGLFVYGSFYSRHSESIEKQYIKQSHKCVGVVYSKKKVHRSHHYIIIRTGIDSLHTREQRVPKDSPLVKTIHVGDTIILRVSDEYPRVNHVLNWHPTLEEIEKYKTPVKLIE